MTLEEWEDRLPFIDWREPQRVSTVEGTFMVCRVCVAVEGLHARDVPGRAFADREAFEVHLRDVHDG